MPRTAGKKTAPRRAEPAAHHRRPLARLAHRLSGARGHPAFARPRARDAVQLAATADRRRALPRSVRGQRRARPRGAVARCRARRRSSIASRRSAVILRRRSNGSAAAMRPSWSRTRCASCSARRSRSTSCSSTRRSIRRCWSRPAAGCSRAGWRRVPIFTWNARRIARCRRCPRSGRVQRTKRAGQVGYHLLRASDPAKEVPP